MAPTLGALVITLALAGCSAATAVPARPLNRLPARSLAPAEIRGTNARTALEAIRHLRPEFLSSLRGAGSGLAGPVIYIDGHRAWGVEELSTIPAETVREVRWLSSSEATLQYGSGHSAGALVVLTGVPRD